MTSLVTGKFMPQHKETMPTAAIQMERLEVHGDGVESMGSTSMVEASRGEETIDGNLKVEDGASEDSLDLNGEGRGGLA